MRGGEEGDEPKLPRGEGPPLAFVPTRVFFTSGVGTHETQRVAMQRALEKAGVSDCNLVKVSSVIPPKCQVISRERGLRLLRPGNILYAVIAQGETNEPAQRVSVSLCWAQPDDDDDELPGYITEIEEDEAKGKSEKRAVDEAGEALLTIMAERIGADADAKKLWEKRGRERRVRIGGRSIRVGSICASTRGPEQRAEKPDYAVAMTVAVFL